jgi:hypothetical protein
MRLRITIRGEGTEIRGYATPEVARALAAATPEVVVVASITTEDYNPFGEEED